MKAMYFMFCGISSESIDLIVFIYPGDSPIYDYYYYYRYQNDL